MVIDDQMMHVAALFSNRTYNALRRAGVMSMKQLRKMSVEEVMLIKGLGKTALYEIKEVVKMQEREKNKGR
jgi:DNA-directed RNA polymerase alpha subunit